MRIGLVTFLITLVIDQLSKILIVFGLDLKVVQTIEVVPPYLVFRMAWNRGVNFGLFSGESDANRWILIGIALIVVGFVLFWVRSETDKKVFVSTGLLVGGAIGNIIDRVVYGAVADFLNMSCCGIENPWSFNVADISIFVGALGLIFLTGESSKGRDAESGTG